MRAILADISARLLCLGTFGYERAPTRHLRYRTAGQLALLQQFAICLQRPVSSTASLIPDIGYRYSIHLALGGRYPHSRVVPVGGHHATLTTFAWKNNCVTGTATPETTSLVRSSSRYIMRSSWPGEGTFGQLAADRPVHGACLSKVDTWRTDSWIKEEELRQQTC